MMDRHIAKLGNAVSACRALVANKLKSLADRLDAGANPDVVALDLRVTAQQLTREFGDLAAALGAVLADVVNETNGPHVLFPPAGRANGEGGSL